MPSSKSSASSPNLTLPVRLSRHPWDGNPVNSPLEARAARQLNRRQIPLTGIAGSDAERPSRVYPDPQPGPPDGLLRALRVGGGQIRPVWQRLAERAVALRQPVPKLGTTSDPEFRVAVNGRTLRPIYW